MAKSIMEANEKDYQNPKGEVKDSPESTEEGFSEEITIELNPQNEQEFSNEKLITHIVTKTPYQVDKKWQDKAVTIYFPRSGVSNLQSLPKNKSKGASP